MSRLKIREISARVANLERHQHLEIPGIKAAIRGQTSVIRSNYEFTIASALGRQERERLWLRVAQEQEDERNKLHRRVKRAERWSFVQTTAILLMLGAWIWTLQ